jgi:nitroimidazol reductase NimA-like FMN-containing flavoprotein (pyridoxamine 5'-phosphate oxidase superfamily)
MTKTSDSFPMTERNQVRRMHQRGSYDREVVYQILDSSLLCSVGYVIDGQPYVTPTSFWREGNTLYWHGSSASRALKQQIGGISVCLTVAHADGLVVARSGFHSSINYRSVMVFGQAHLIEDIDVKREKLDIFIDRFIPGRTAANRSITAQELKATKLLGMDIEEASAKIRVGQPVDDEEDYALPVWAGVVNFKTVVAGIDADPKNLSGVAVPPGLASYGQGEKLDDVLKGIYDGDAYLKAAPLD